MDYNPVQPPLSFNYLNPLLHVPSPIVPQNPLRPTSKGCGECGALAGLRGDCGCDGLGGCGCGCTEGKVGNTLMGIGALGQDELVAQLQPPRWLVVFYGFLRLAGSGLGAYHGYRRHNGSVGWAIGWGVLGGLFPIITTGVALAQGYGRAA